MAKFLLLNGPNLNLLGRREPDIYGATTLDDIVRTLKARSEGADHSLDAYQSNAEHELVGHVQTAMTEGVDCIIVNPAAFTHTSVALRDALLAAGIPFIEIHLSNIHAREDFRRNSYFSDVAAGVIAGFGAKGYELALEAAIHLTQKS